MEFSPAFPMDRHKKKKKKASYFEQTGMFTKHPYKIFKYYFTQNCPIEFTVSFLAPITAVTAAHLEAKLFPSTTDAYETNHVSPHCSTKIAGIFELPLQRTECLLLNDIKDQS